MKKINILFLMCLCFLLVSCTKKDVDAEITFINENQEETSYIIKKTDNTEDVKNLFQILDQVKIDTNFTGVSLNMNSSIEGNIEIEGMEIRTIDLGYTLGLSATSNLRKYQLEGTVNLEGYTKTNSDSLSFDTTQNLTGSITNDDEYLYLAGTYKNGGSSIRLKNKLNISNITEKYKFMIVSSLDLLKYYNLSSIIPNINEKIDELQITIIATTKDSFTLRLKVPAKEIFTVENEEKVIVDITLSCLNLLPTEVSFVADDLIFNLLKEKYINNYLTDQVIVNHALFSIQIKLEYGMYTITELSEEDKLEYIEYFIIA